VGLCFSEQRTISKDALLSANKCLWLSADFSTFAFSQGYLWSRGGDRSKTSRTEQGSFPLDCCANGAVEVSFKMCVVVCSVLILGTAIAKTACTLQELYKLEADYAEAKLELRRCLKATDTYRIYLRASYALQKNLTK